MTVAGGPILLCPMSASTNATSACRASSTSVKYRQKLLLPTAEPPITRTVRRPRSKISDAAAPHSGGTSSLRLGSAVKACPLHSDLAMAGNYSCTCCRRVTPKMIVSTSCETAPPLGRFHTVDCTVRRPVLSEARVFGCDVLPVVAGFAGIYQAC